MCRIHNGGIHRLLCHLGHFYNSNPSHAQHGAWERFRWCWAKAPNSERELYDRLIKSFMYPFALNDLFGEFLGSEQELSKGGTKRGLGLHLR